MVIRATTEDAYFAASNSSRGFYSYYTECFDDARIEHLYAIKGGPGTGKSRFMREVADAGMGVGWRGEFIYCSSDPDSLDGVILSREGRTVALLDATAPHVYEPSRPGAREDLVNLGVFWDSDRLSAQAADIGRLQAQKSAAYQRAYRYLAAFGEMRAAGDSLVLPYVRRAAIRAFAARLIEAEGEGVGWREQTALMHAVGMGGAVGLDTYFHAAKQIFLIRDCRGAARYLTADLRALAKERGHAVRVSHDPVMPDCIDAIFFLKTQTLFVLCPPKLCAYPHRIIDLRRFVNTAAMKAVRREVNFTARMERECMKGAVGALAAVRESHFALEEIYSAAMNFAAKETFTKIFCRELFGLQNS